MRHRGRKNRESKELNIFAIGKLKHRIIEKPRGRVTERRVHVNFLVQINELSDKDVNFKAQIVEL